MEGENSQNEIIQKEYLECIDLELILLMIIWFLQSKSLPNENAFVPSPLFSGAQILEEFVNIFPFWFEHVRIYFCFDEI